MYSRQEREQQKTNSTTERASHENRNGGTVKKSLSHSPSRRILREADSGVRKRRKRSVYVCRTRERSTSNKKLYFTSCCGDKEKKTIVMGYPCLWPLEGPSRPAPGRGCNFCFVLGRGRGRGYCKYH